jgi:hypothetical protein
MKSIAAALLAFGAPLHGQTIARTYVDWNAIRYADHRGSFMADE